MTIQFKILALTAIVMAALGAVMLSTARGSGESENPFWKVAGTRLESGTKGVTVESVKTEGETISLHSTIGGKEIEARCGTAKLSSAYIEGSAAKHDGKVSGVLEISECKLWAKEGEAYKEQTGCAIPSFKSGTLTGGLWLEGTKAAGGTTAVVLFEPKELTGGKAEIAKIEIESRETEKCSAFAGAHVLEGKFAARLLPQNEEFRYMRWVLPSTAISPVWRPPSEETEQTIGLKLEGNTGTLQGELQAERGGTEKFGGGTAPLAGVEAPFWKIKGERLEAGKEASVESGELDPEPAKLKGTLKGVEIEIRCEKLLFKEAVLIGSLEQHDGKFFVKEIEFSGCKVFIGGVEASGCEVAAFHTAALTSRLWLEGTKAERKTKGLLVFEPESGSFVMEPVIKAKSGDKCCPEGPMEIAGSFAIRLNPEDSEAEDVHFSSPGFSSVHVWQSAEQENERIVELVHESLVVIITIPEFPVKLKAGGTFGFTE
jgi:hypothetical protein